MSKRQDQMKNIVREACAGYLATVSNGTSLITITDTNISPDMKQATIFISVYPREGEVSALNFVKRQRAEMRDYVKERMSSRVVPFLDVKIDEGEKHRQKIDDLLRQG